MKPIHAAGVAVVFVSGIVVGLAASAPKSSPELYRDKPPAAAAAALLEAARGQAGRGSWENIAVARTWYLGGDRGRAQQILDQVTSAKPKASDWLRIGRLYVEAGQWELATAAFDRVLALDPNDSGSLAEIGAWTNLHGDRARAEELFARSFARSNDDVWNTLAAAGSYLGVKPQP